MTNEELKSKLDHGDYVKIARMVGYTDITDGRKYVSRVLAGKISGTKGLAKQIVDAAHTIATQNESSHIHTDKEASPSTGLA